MWILHFFCSKWSTNSMSGSFLNKCMKINWLILLVWAASEVWVVSRCIKLIIVIGVVSYTAVVNIHWEDGKEFLEKLLEIVVKVDQLLSEKRTVKKNVIPEEIYNKRYCASHTFNEHIGWNYELIFLSLWSTENLQSVIGLEF